MLLNCFKSYAISLAQPIFGMFGMLVIILLTGCGSTANQPADHSQTPAETKKTENFSATIPDTLERTLVMINGQLSAEIIIDKGKTSQKSYEMKVDLANDKVTGAIDELEQGSHTVEIVYNIINNGTKVEIASGNRVITVIPEKTTAVAFTASDLRYTDTDQDGFTNLAELELGANYNNAASRPVAELPRSSANYVLTDSMEGSPTDGKPIVAGVSASANYTLY